MSITLYSKNGDAKNLVETDDINLYKIDVIGMNNCVINNSSISIQNKIVCLSIDFSTPQGGINSWQEILKLHNTSINIVTTKDIICCITNRDIGGDNLICHFTGTSLYARNNTIPFGNYIINFVYTVQ